jgi:membrane-bound lytic murein transglycosylase MltF
MPGFLQQSGPMPEQLRPAVHVLFLLSLISGPVACGGDSKSSSGSSGSSAPAPTATPAAPPIPAPEEELPPSELETSLPPAVHDAVLKDFKGDFDEMIEHRLVRVGVTPSRTFYFVDKGVQRGVAYHYAHLMEERINAKVGSGNIKVHVVLVPMPRAKLVPALVDGKIDIAAGTLTITPERQALVDFTDPTRTNVNEIIVTGPGSKPITSLEDLSGQRIYVRSDSSYEASLKAFNETLAAKGKPPVTIEDAPDNLQDDDLLEMVNAGLIPIAVVHDYLARFWKKVFPKLVLHEDIPVHSATSLGVAVRKNNPKLHEALNNFMGRYGLGTAFGDKVERKYLVNMRYVKSASSDAERKKFLAMVDLFRKYSDKYSMDFLLMAAQGYQESRLDQNARSPVGAIGVMQVMPPTGRDMNVGDIYLLEPNIHAGVKYMRRVMDANFKDATTMTPINKGLMTFASYNAGPGRVRALRREAEKRGLDPDVWFGNVEQIASERIGRETVTYVSNIYKYYVAYRLVVDDQERRRAAKEAVKTGGS